MNRSLHTLLLALMLSAGLPAQNWVPDLGNGRYRNPVMFAGYSDPDVIRVGDDFYLSISRSDGQFRPGMYEGTYNHCADATVNIESVNLMSGACYLHVFVNENGICHFSCSLDDETYSYLGKEFHSAAGVWIGAKAGLFSLHSNVIESEGFAEVDWFRITE
jgi:hypothetical protein